jgi:hypothetical protein
MTCWRLKIRKNREGRRRGFTSGDDPGFLVHVGVGAVLLDHLVVNAQQEERGGPLADEQGMMVLAVVFRMREPRIEVRAAPRKKLVGSLAE